MCQIIMLETKEIDSQLRGNKRRKIEHDSALSIGDSRTVLRPNFPHWMNRKLVNIKFKHKKKLS